MTMKKLFNFLMSLIIMIAMVACTCTPKQETPVDEPTTEVVEGTMATVENLISLDRQSMFAKYAEDYKWFETGIQLVNWLDEENDGSYELVVNVFQAAAARDEGSYDTFVVKFQHVGEDVYEEAVQGFWVEDLPLNEDDIKLTYQDAYEKVMAVNLPKPHTRQVVLRKPLGPKACNPQWVFGNIHTQIWVDAVTGEVRESNPAFEGLNFGTPLGEWP